MWSIHLYSEARKKRRVMKVPKGTSDYQATWIIDDAEQGEEDNDVDSCDDEEDGMMEDEMDGDNESQVGFYNFDTGQSQVFDVIFPYHTNFHFFLLILIFLLDMYDPGELCKSEGKNVVIVGGGGGSLADHMPDRFLFIL